MLNVHVNGSFYVSQPAYKVMKSQGDGGRFVFISSNCGAFGLQTATHYAVAKAALLGLTNNIALEGAQYGILANAVLPFGTTRLSLLAGQPDPGTVLAHSDPELVVPLVAFLASRSCQLTHHVYSACAGRYARVFMGLGEGWHTPLNTVPTDEEFAANFDSMTSSETYTIPLSVSDEMQSVALALGIGS